MQNIKLLYPIALLIIPIYFICLYYCKQKKQRLFFPNISLLKNINKKSSTLTNILKTLAIIALSIALSSPYSKDDIIIQKDRGYEISLILDASGSMAELNKFEIVKEIVSDFVKKREHDKLALSIFADFAYVAIPLTYDKKSIQRLLSKIDVGIAGKRKTALYEALFMSSKLFKDSKSKEKIAILLTDGIDNANTIPLDVAINTAKKYGIKVYVIGVGSRGDYNPYVLKEIASKTNGEFFEANSIERLKAIYKKIDSLEKSQIKADKYIKRTYYFQYPLSLAILFMILYFVYKNRRSYAI